MGFTEAVESRKEGIELLYSTGKLMAVTIEAVVVVARVFVIPSQKTVAEDCCSPRHSVSPPTPHSHHEATFSSLAQISGTVTFANHLAWTWHSGFSSHEALAPEDHLEAPLRHCSSPPALLLSCLLPPRQGIQ
ncbi:hypothetical protein O3P69_017828 [Scylla paramamosain]|uniref:Uncharacterized protein n=1 Tax=Scylla paramamosain TaxID=85552 RepID=A0AAW0TH52_SCYPA